MGDEPYVSVRKWIKWGDKPSEENTYTQVLTSPQKYFTDTRIYLPPTTSPLSSHPASPLLPLSRLEWAFAGTSSTTPATETTPKHTVWTHTIDSKTSEEVQDEGDMFPPSVNEFGEEVVLERGSMENPETGEVEEYEECWVDVPISALSGEEKRRGWVLTTSENTTSGKGMIIRIGGVIQGVFRSTAGDIGVRRWRWGGVFQGGVEKSEGEAAWKVTLSIGELSCPIDIKGFETLERSMEVGTRIEGEEVGWECVEVMEW